MLEDPGGGAARREGGSFKAELWSSCRGWLKMKLHCEVEVVSRRLPALGMRNRGKGIRAVLSLCQQTPGSRPRPRAGGERGGPLPTCLVICTLRDKRGTRYEVRGPNRPCLGSQPRALPLRASRVPEAGACLWGTSAPSPPPVLGVSLWTRKRKAFESAPSPYFSFPFLWFQIDSVSV